MKPSLPKGTRDFSPDVVRRRNYIFNVIRGIFEKYGFQPLETPALENLSVLTGKYGEEGDKLLFKILNSGDFLKGVKVSSEKLNYRKLTPEISEKGLRYDLTVPLARYVSMNLNEVTFPFKRYQIQPVWRADRPQKGRYREFYQCDADVIGSDSLLCEVEFVLIINEVFQQLGIEQYTIKINSRKLLNGVASYLEQRQNAKSFFVILDKMEKIGRRKMLAELMDSGFTERSISKLEEILTIKNEYPDQITVLKELLAAETEALIALGEIEKIKQYVEIDFGIPAAHLTFDPTLARGLSYYTGTIFEVSVENVDIGSVGGGGRYDNLTGVFGLEGVSGIGFSFGVDRLYDVLDTLLLFPDEQLAGTKVMISNFDEDTLPYSLKKLQEFRGAEISAEIYPDQVKLKKQLSYANKRSIPYIGPEEVGEEKITLKDMQSGNQMTLNIEDAIKKLSIS